MADDADKGNGNTDNKKVGDSDNSYGGRLGYWRWRMTRTTEMATRIIVKAEDSDKSHGERLE